MIQCELPPIGIQAQGQLNAFLARHEFDTVKAVVEAKVKSEQSAALKAAIEAGPGNDKMQEFDAIMSKARRYQSFLDVLEEIQKQAVHHTAKLT